MREDVEFDAERATDLAPVSLCKITHSYSAGGRWNAVSWLFFLRNLRQRRRVLLLDARHAHGLEVPHEIGIEEILLERPGHGHVRER